MICFSNITGQFMEAGIHRLRTTIHLTRMIDDTLAYLRPRCSTNSPCFGGSSFFSSQLFSFLLSKQYPKHKHKLNATTENHKDENLRKVLFSKSLNIYIGINFCSNDYNALKYYRNHLFYSI